MLRCGFGCEGREIRLEVNSVFKMCVSWVNNVYDMSIMMLYFSHLACRASHGIKADEQLLRFFALLHLMHPYSTVQYRSISIYMVNLEMTRKLPPFPRQLTNPTRNPSKANFEPCPPPLTIQPLPLQPTPLMKLLLCKIILNLVPRHQTRQHANPPHQIPPPAIIQVNAAPIRRVQARIIGKHFLLLRGQRHRLRRLVGERRVEHAVRQRHRVEIQRRRAAKPAAPPRWTEFRAEDVVGACGADVVA